jgi:thioredoxin 1
MALALSMSAAGCSDRRSASGDSSREDVGADGLLTELTTVGEFNDQVLGAKEPVLVDFYATWCGPCQVLAPTIHDLAREYKGRAKFVKVNVDKAHELVAKYNVDAYPTVVIFSGGNVAAPLLGVHEAGAYRAALNAALDKGPAS